MKSKIKKYIILKRFIQLTVFLLFLMPLFGLHKIYFGSMLSSELFGIELLDPVTFFENLLSTKAISGYALQGFLLVTFLYWITGGRSFCGWICPVNTITEFFEPESKSLREKKINRFSLNYKKIALLYTLGLSFLFMFPVFSAISPIGHTSKAITMGAVSSFLPITAIVFIERYFPRVWCRSVCPVGAYYSFVSKISPFSLKIEIDNCTSCNKCRLNCQSFELLEPMISGTYNKDLSGECNYCLKCIDQCETNALYLIKKPEKLGVRK